MKRNRQPPLLFLVIGGAASTFYLFVYPALVALGRAGAGLAPILLGLILYFQLWLLVAEYGYVAAAHLYGWRRKSLFLPLFRPLPRGGASAFPSRPSASGFLLVATSLFSYFITLYGFALAYFFLSQRSDEAFRPGALGLLDSVYFSVVTAATVGFGDISPVTPVAKILVICEILASFVYTVFIFSLLAAGLRGKSASQ